MSEEQETEGKETKEQETKEQETQEKIIENLRNIGSDNKNYDCKGDRLICACRIGNLEEVKKILEKDDSQVNKELDIFITHFDYEHREILSREPNRHRYMDQADIFLCFTPLQAAINYKHTNIVKYLVENYQGPVDLIGKTTNDDENSLHYTAIHLNQNTEILKFLIDAIETQTNKMQIINQQTKFDVSTPLDIAYMCGASNEFIKLLLNNHATANHYKDGERIDSHFDYEEGGIVYNVQEIIEKEAGNDTRGYRESTILRF